MVKRPYVLTIAGFDPSNGAGLTADIKTIEALKGYGLSVCTANTIQNDVEFKTCYWTDIDVIKSQVDILFDRFTITYVKIGIVQNWKILNAIIDVVLEKNDGIKIILDPVLKSSSDFDFHSSNDDSDDQNNIEKQFEEVLDKIYLLTPNYNEIEKLYSSKTIEETIVYISSKTNLFLKGGHRKEAVGKDELFTTSGKNFTFNPKRQNVSEKHGSGCVLSSAITTYLALGFSLIKACYRGKRYTEKILSSNSSLLGYHRV
ncbi:hydroxymethylpyrimidine/phosphomethylpyrimidine kinase [Aquimarina sp. MAR_2010_214]|uniref:hydroxymethylpyrimidine/phosphomethylpyrimidine kinase n=1 Tax=Aquimarina sp. MAR_2010_214 TaxID=1250026 RepID=UPI000C705DDC|nr:hydroxymethylpyrimidine/phosphomethylpyrimidine kinase [Aquimarina sp. MAR_2010_214]PKV48415.1 hydroxymethylpyrimidine/phosphomethylpyrimidine kinase [Aquimarina sp. MAR_2010_214]